jgi:hypothetical protein
MMGDNLDNHIDENDHYMVQLEERLGAISDRSSIQLPRGVLIKSAQKYFSFLISLFGKVKD